MLTKNEVITWLGFEEALIGYAERHCDAPVAIYDFEKMVCILMDRDEMSRQEALEYIDFNVSGAYVGCGTPLMLYEFDIEDDAHGQ